MPWRIGIVGCGYAGEQHALAMAALGEQRAVLRAVADSDGGRAAACAQAWQAPLWTTDYQALLADPHLDAVAVCLPHDLHADVAIAALASGRHVLVEKPLAASLAEADAMIEAAERSGRCLMVAETVRFDNTNLTVADLLRSGRIGRPFLFRIAREHEMHDYLRQRPWFLQQASAGIMLSGGIHDFELLRMLGGEIDHVYGLAAPKALAEMAADDTSVALVQLQSGAAAVLVESFSLKTPQPGVHGSVHGTHGSLWFHDAEIRLYTAEQDGHAEWVETIQTPADNPFEAEWRHFLECIASGVESITSARRQRPPLAAVLAVYASFVSGQRVYV